MRLIDQYREAVKVDRKRREEEARDCIFEGRVDWGKFSRIDKYVRDVVLRLGAEEGILSETRNEGVYFLYADRSMNPRDSDLSEYYFIKEDEARRYSNVIYPGKSFSLAKIVR